MSQRWRSIVDLIARACAERGFGHEFYGRAVRAAEYLSIEAPATEFVYVERPFWGRDLVLRVTIPPSEGFRHVPVVGTPEPMRAEDLDQHGVVFGLKRHHDGLITLCIGDDGWWHPKATFSPNWLPELSRLLATIVPFIPVIRGTDPGGPRRPPSGLWFRKRPFLVQAFQMTKERRWDNSEWPGWLSAAWNKDSWEVGAFYCGHAGVAFPGVEPLWLRTVEGGTVPVTWGAWIIRGVQGELYPCDPAIFATIYEPVSDAVDAPLSQVPTEGAAGVARSDG